MDFSFTDDQLEVQGLARRILGDTERDTWAELGAAGLLGIALSEEAGGGGQGLLTQCLVLEEIGRAVAHVPVLASIVSAAMPIDRFGTSEQRKRWAAPAADGTMVLTAALTEPLNRDPVAPFTTATPEGDRWRLDGVKTCVPAGTVAAAMLIPAATPDGTAVFIVDRDAPGVRVAEQETTSGDVEGHVELDGVEIGGDRLLGTPASGAEVVEWTVQRTTVGLCALQLGITEEALRRTADYTKTRVQFERPIATFQAVGQRCADAYIDVEGIRLTLWQAAWRLEEGVPAATEVEVAKFWAADGGHRVVHAAVHLHGGMGVAVEYPIHRYFIAAKQIEFSLGGATEQRLRIGARLAAEPVA